MSDHDHGKQFFADASARAAGLREDILSLRRVFYDRGQEWPDNGDWALRALSDVIAKLDAARLELETMRLIQEMFQ